jgi:hypothetical protein
MTQRAWFCSNQHSPRQPCGAQSMPSREIDQILPPLKASACVRRPHPRLPLCHTPVEQPRQRSAAAASWFLVIYTCIHWNNPVSCHHAPLQVLLQPWVAIASHRSLGRPEHLSPVERPRRVSRGLVVPCTGTLVMPWTTSDALEH